MRDPDQQFFDSFMIVIGILIGVAVGLFFIVRMIAIDTQGEYVLDDPEVQAQIDERIKPVGRVLLMGDAELAAAASAPTVAPEQVHAPMSGAQVFNAACYLCHSPPGVGGAPVVGNSEAWAGRVAEGMDVLTQHALNGFQGSTGVMPAKGGRPDLSDDEIKSAIEYMLSQLPQQAQQAQ